MGWISKQPIRNRIKPRAGSINEQGRREIHKRKWWEITSHELFRFSSLKTLEDANEDLREEGLQVVSRHGEKKGRDNGEGIDVIALGG